MNLDQEEEYINRVKQKDERAFEVLVKHYQSRVYSLVMGMVKNEDDALELSQDVFLKVFQKIEGFEFNSKFSTWLYSITYNHCISFLRKKNIKWQTLEEDSVHVPQADFKEYSSLEKEERSRFLKLALDEMPIQQKLLVQLYYLEELSIKEIKEVTKLGESSIKTGLLRARKNLLKQLQINLNEEVKLLL